MTKEDIVVEDTKTRQLSLRMPESLVSLVEEEMSRRGISVAAPIYVEAVKFYFDHKDDPLFKSPVELDTLIEQKFSDLLEDPNRIQRLRERLFRL